MSSSDEIHSSTASRWVSARSDPSESFLPLLKMMELPLATCSPLFDMYPRTAISVPSASAFLVMPTRSRLLGVLPSMAQLVTVPSASFTAMWMYACGFTHSILVTVPCRMTTLFWSNWAANEWWAQAGTVAATMNRSALRIRITSCTLLNLQDQFYSLASPEWVPKRRQQQNEPKKSRSPIAPG